MRSNALSIDKNLLYQYLRRELIAHDRHGIDDGDALRGWEPKGAVTRLDSGGLSSTVRFNGQEPVLLVVGDGCDRRNFAVRDVIQFLLSHAVDTLIGTHPEPSPVVFENSKHAVTRKPLAHRHTAELPVFAPGQSAVIRADPEDSVSILVEAADVVAREPVRRGVCRDLPVHHRRESPARPDPQGAVQPVQQRYDVVVRQSIVVREDGCRSF